MPDPTHEGRGRHGDHLPLGILIDPIGLIGKFTIPQLDPRFGTSVWMAIGIPIAECFNCGAVMDEKQHEKGECPHCLNNLLESEGIGEDV